MADSNGVTRDSREAGHQPVQPEGGAVDWTDAQIDALVGITDDGQISPAVLADARADARRYPELNALLKATADDGDSRTA